MKVIKLGQPAVWSREETCTGEGNGNNGCGSILLVEESDLYRTSNHSFDGTGDYFVTFKCCNCKAETDIKNLPDRIRRKVLSGDSDDTL